MKKYTIILTLSFLLAPSLSFAQGKSAAIQRITQQRDIADNNCRNNLPNPRAAIGFCKKRDGLQRKLDNMNKGQSYNNNNRYDRNNDRNQCHNNNRHQHCHNNNYNR